MTTSPGSADRGTSVASFVQSLQESGVDPCLILVDELHYGHNLAHLLCLADACGVDAIVLPKGRTISGVTPAVRALAGEAARRVPLIRESPMSALSALRRAGVLVVGADEHAPHTYDKIPLVGPLAFVLGGEDKGVTDAVKRKCDVVVRLPMRGRVPSLNVAVAAAALVFERQRQRTASGTTPASSDPHGE